MTTLNSHHVLIDLRRSSYYVPTPTLAYFRRANFAAKLSSTICRARGPRKGNRSSKSSCRKTPSPEIRRPSDRFSSGNGSLPVPRKLHPAATTLSPEEEDAAAAAELKRFLEMLPVRMRKQFYYHEEIGGLIEVVMDLGRMPIARFPSGDWIISDQPIKTEDLRYSMSQVGEFSEDNRSGIDKSLHRISAIRNRKMQIIGLTCRVGRAVSGSAEMIRDLVRNGGSILVIGPPGVGKTTLIREIARMLADEFRRRVVIVDTSNEIAGDGDVPHEGIGTARRMQVPNVKMQHNIMIEAVENHMPQAIIIDEIGTELEALAATSIAQRGVQLVGTAHGMTIESIMTNPSLQILVGGIESVTLGDEEAKKRKVQKTILERKGAPTFSCAVELISNTECHIHHRLDATIDAILAGKSPLFEVRQWEGSPNDLVQYAPIPEKGHGETPDLTENNAVEFDRDVDGSPNDLVQYVPIPEKSHGKTPDLTENNAVEFDGDDIDHPPTWSKKSSTSESVIKRSSPVKVYTYKILEADILQVVKVMGLEDVIDVTDDIGVADLILASSSEIRKNQWIRGVAKFHQLPVFVIKSNTMAQIVKAVRMILGQESFGPTPKKPLNDSCNIEIEGDEPTRKPSLEEIDALEEVRLAIEYIVIPGGEPVELLPRRSDIIARQLELVKSYQLAAENSGTEQNPRLQILPMRLNTKRPTKSSSGSHKKPRSSNPVSSGGHGTSVTRLPFLPE